MAPASSYLRRSGRVARVGLLRAARALGLVRVVLVNLVYLDPPANGGLSRAAREFSRAICDLAAANWRCRPVFVVNGQFAEQFESWLGCKAEVIPFDPATTEPNSLESLAPDLIVHALFGVEPFHRVERFSQVPQIALMPDALALDFPEYFGAAALAQRRAMYDRLKDVDHVVTLSAHSRDRLAAHLGGRVRITAIPLGADAVTAQAAALPFDPSLRYLYYPANDWPHKRHDLLMRIFALVAQRAPDMHLVLTGGRSDKSDLPGLAAAHGVPRERVHDLAYVDDATVAALYAHAQALVFPSAYEGFGMPVLEAMRAKCPVVCSDRASVPEIAGDAAIVVTSDDPDAWTRAILDELPPRREALVALGLARAAQYTWAATRTRYMEFFRTTAPNVFGN